MLRLLLVLVFALPVAAQEKKPKPKKVAEADPAKVAADPDFAAQGEYAGKSPDGSEAWGAQVIARGDGQFDVKMHKGGLPGAGWDGGSTLTAKGVRGSRGVEVSAEGKVVATIAGGVMTNADPRGFPLKKVERSSPTLGLKPPAGAVVLFAGPDDLSRWAKGKLATHSDGTFLTVSGTGGIRTTEQFGAFRLHVEFRLPWMPASRGQARANSGVYLQDRYEVQVLDSFGLAGENNECGGVYQQHKPKVNLCLPPLVWQTYDIEFRPAAFDEAGTRLNPAVATVRHNGVLIQDNIAFKGPTGGGKAESAAPGPLQFQDHGDPVMYRNVWVVPVK